MIEREMRIVINDNCIFNIHFDDCRNKERERERDRFILETKHLSDVCYVDFLLQSSIFLYVNIVKLFTEMIRAFSTFNHRYIIYKILFWFQLFFVPFNFIERRSGGEGSLRSKNRETFEQLSTHDES